LHEKQLEFRSHYVDVLSLVQHRPDFLQAARETRLPLEGEGPILVHDGRQITESLFILEYLEDAFPQRSLRPAEPILQARILAWARFINEVFMPAVSTLGCRAYLAPQLKGQAAALGVRRWPAAAPDDRSRPSHPGPSIHAGASGIALNP
jgi:glutathione S-transferase